MTDRPDPSVEPQRCTCGHTEEAHVGRHFAGVLEPWCECRTFAPPATTGQPDPQEEARKDKLFAQANAIACVPEDAEPPLLPPITSAQFLAIRREAYEYLRAAHRQGFEEGQKAGREEAE